VAESRQRTGIGGSPVGTVGVILIGVLALVAAVMQLFAVWRFWPPSPPATGDLPATTKFSYLDWDVTLTRDQQLLLIVALAGGLGATLHGLRSLARYVGERYLFRSWLLYYAVLPIVGAIMGTIVYLVLRAGLLAGAANTNQTDPYGVAAIAGLVGLFSAQAAEKLKAVFETLFSSSPPGSESLSDATSTTITGFEPTEGPVGTLVTITGVGLEGATEVVFTAGIQATDVQIAEGQVTASVPVGATTGPITVRIGTDEVVSAQDYVVPVLIE
jgi:hypothetical protein